MLCFHLLAIYLFNSYLVSVRGKDLGIFSTQNGGGISPECTDESKIWTGCLLSNPECLYGHECADADGGDNGGASTEAEFNCQLIPTLCVTVSCCSECHVSGLELLNCEADVRDCSNECDLPTREPSAVPTISMTPSNVPTTIPSSSPSKFPSASPSPTTVPSDSPSDVPSKSPTKSLLPSLAPSNTPSSSPSEKPTASPFPSQQPTKVHSEEPSAEPTEEPSNVPTNMHSEKPSASPSISTPVPTLTPIPQELVAKSDYRCGVTEADARSNCKPECTVSTDCLTGETCWTTHINYCHIMPPNHPQCADTTIENTILRCGYDEMAARGFCGTACTNELDCTVPGEKCFPLIRNMCACFEEQDVLDQVIPDATLYATDIADNFRRLVDSNAKLTNQEYFQLAKSPLKKYYNPEDSKSDATSSSEQESTSKQESANEQGYAALEQEQYSAAVIAANNGHFLLIGSTSLLLAISFLLL